ncbi:MAG: hypothetical protein NT076_02940 [Candidatus Pacearchaeota archaeon]|nr:hypothetical protein [Candidatus Pacearchaeota archaeon]
MAKEDKPIFLKVLLVIIIIALLNVGTLLYMYGNFSDGISGFSIFEITSNAYQQVSKTSKMFFIAEWSLIFIFLFFSMFKDSKIRSRIREVQSIKLKKELNQTDIDVLYNLIKDKKQLRISTISKVFEVNEDIAIDWVNILEAANFVKTDYLGGEAIVKIKQ